MRTTHGHNAITFVIATRNAHKVVEIRAILGDQFQYRTLNDYSEAPKVVEDANSFAGNATKKAVQLAEWLARRLGTESRLPGTQTFVLADDSGLEVEALGGAPGVHSARFASLDESAGEKSASLAGNSVDAANNAKLLRLLQNVPVEKRTARFRCVLALSPVVAADSENRSPVCYASDAEVRTELFDGVCEGRISFAPSGQKGFGYDPLFIPTGHHQSFAELGEEVKNKMSHRAKALEKLSAWLKREE